MRLWALLNISHSTLLNWHGLYPTSWYKPPLFVSSCFCIYIHKVVQPVVLRRAAALSLSLWRREASLALWPHLRCLNLFDRFFCDHVVMDLHYVINFSPSTIFTSAGYWLVATVCFDLQSEIDFQSAPLFCQLSFLTKGCSAVAQTLGHHLQRNCV
jgi:hypothetical protein